MASALNLVKNLVSLTIGEGTSPSPSSTSTSFTSSTHVTPNSEQCYDLESVFGPSRSKNVDDFDGNCEHSVATQHLERPSLRTLHLSSNKSDKSTLTDILKIRVDADAGECVWEVGVEDDGTSQRLSPADFDQSMQMLRMVANDMNCDVSILHERDRLVMQSGEAASPTSADKENSDKSGFMTMLASSMNASVVNASASNDKEGDGFRYAHVLVRQRSGSVADLNELRIAVVGNVDAGKSTTLGVLSRGGLDDGRGSSRLALFRHKHESDSGRTSSVGMEIMGFSSTGIPITPGATSKSKLTWEEISMHSSKVITFLDLAGHEKYLKTTVFGMTGCDPMFSMIVVGANAGIVGMSKEHLGIALARGVPVFIVITKVDMCPPNILASTIKQLSKLLRSSGCRKIPMYINTIEDVLVTSNNFVSERICPIFQISNVTGQCLDLLRLFLNLIRSTARTKYSSDSPVEYQITDTFSVPGVGTVISGVLVSGIVHVGDTLLLGPDSTGAFTSTIIKSIHRKRVNVPLTTAGQSASFALKRVKRAAIRKGMVMLSKTDPPPQACLEFEAEILVLYHSTSIGPHYQAMMHINCVRQTAKIVHMEKSILRTGDRAKVRFRFMQHSEYIKPNTRILFRESRTKGIGTITQVFPMALPVA